MSTPQETSIYDFNYDLPADRIALQPLTLRDESKLLVFKDGAITDNNFRDIAEYIPSGSIIVFNDTCVINARLLFQKNTGSVIEIFCLEPAEQTYVSMMGMVSPVRWKCMIGGISKWKTDVLTKKITIDNEEAELQATLIGKESESYIVEFSWRPADISFASILEVAGKVPLPPYIKREVIANDKERYQTVYARLQGSVAAPTAGLHFTDDVLVKLKAKDININYVTLHVSAGTFRPVKAKTMEGHSMHGEWICVRKEVVDKLLANRKHLTAVGTTSARTLETLYWLGVKIIANPEIKELHLEQWECYSLETKSSTEDALRTLSGWMNKNALTELYCSTRLLIVPGYRFRLVNALVTNFHQPQSTLLLLVAAATAGQWKIIYDHALQHDYRFLSYGDSNLIFIDQG